MLVANGVTLDEVSDRIIRFYYSFFAYGKITRKNSGNSSKWKTTDVILRTRQEDVASLGIPVLPVPAGSSVGSGLLKGNIKLEQANIARVHGHVLRVIGSHSVSYTHLDVYKRQFQACRPPSDEESLMP